MVTTMRPFVRVRARWSKLALLLALEALLVALAVFASSSWWREHRLRTEGVVADAEVVSVVRRGRRADVLYRLPLGGRIHWRANLFGQEARWASVSRREGDAAEVRNTIRVRYLPSDPRVSAPERGRVASNGQVAIGLALFALGLPFALLQSRRRARREAAIRGYAEHALWSAVRGPRTF